MQCMYTKWPNIESLKVSILLFVSHIHYNYLYSCLITRGRTFDKGIVDAIQSVVIRVVTSITRCP